MEKASCNITDSTPVLFDFDGISYNYVFEQNDDTESVGLSQTNSDNNHISGPFIYNNCYLLFIIQHVI